jgi:hypothetical protein
MDEGSKMTIEVYGFLDEISPTHRLPLTFEQVLIDTETNKLLLAPFEWQSNNLVGWDETIELEHFEGTKVVREEAEPGYCLYSAPGSLVTSYVSLAYAAEEIRRFAETCMKYGDQDLRAVLQNYEDAAAAAQGPDCFARMLLLPISRKRRERMQKCLADVATLNPPSLHVEKVLEEIFGPRRDGYDGFVKPEET